MNLGIYLGIGESLKQMEKSGQKDRFINLYLKRYAKDFRKVYLFSYENESCTLPENVIIVSKKLSIHRYLYSLLIPIVNYKQVNDCDILRGFGLTSAVPAFLSLKPFVFNLPYNYSDFLKIENKYLLIPAFYILEKLAFLKSKIVLVATRQKFQRLNGKKFIYLPNGVDLKRFRSKTNTGKGLVYVGRFEKQKNLFFLLDAISKLPSSKRSITFIGQGSQEQNLRQYAIAKDVSLTIVPPVSNQQLPKLLSKFSIFTFSSFAEGSSKILLEAMAMGLIPLITNFKTAKEVIKEGYNGFITSFDTINYSKRLEELIVNTKLRKKISANARKTIIKNFNHESLLLKEIKLLKEAAV